MHTSDNEIDETKLVNVNVKYRFRLAEAKAMEFPKWKS